MDAYWAAPPVTRTITALTAATSILVYAGIVDPYNIIFYPPLIFTLKKFPPQIWRLASSFWLTGPKLSIIFEPYFLYTYGTGLEVESPRFGRKGDFMAYIIFCEAVILILCGGFLGGYSFLQALILSLAYTFSQDNPDSRTSFFIVQVSTKYLPYCVLGLTFIMAGPTATYQQATGLLAAHAYDFLTRIWPTFGGGRNWIEWATPNALRRAFGEGVGGRTQNVRSYGTSFSGRTPAAATAAGAGSGSGQNQGQSTGWSNPLSNWGQRGAGRRLGGD